MLFTILATHLQPIRNGNVQLANLPDPLIKNVRRLRRLELRLYRSRNTSANNSLSLPCASVCHLSVSHVPSNARILILTYQHRRVILPVQRHGRSDTLDTNASNAVDKQKELEGY